MESLHGFCWELQEGDLLHLNETKVDKILFINIVDALFRYEYTIAGELTVEDHVVPARFQRVFPPSSCIWERTGDYVL